MDPRPPSVVDRLRAIQSPTAGKSRRPAAWCRRRPVRSASISPSCAITRNVAPKATATRAGSRPSARNGSKADATAGDQPNAASRPGSGLSEVNDIQWHVPVRDEDLEAPLFFMLVLVLVGEELLDQRGLVHRGRIRRL